MYGTGHFFLRGFYDFAFLCKKFEDQLNWSRLEADFARSGFRKTLISYLLASDEFCGFKDPLQDVRIKKSERLFLHAVNIHLEYPSVFSLLKLMSSYKQVFLEILPDRRRRNEFLKKLKTLQFYARQIRHVRQSFLKQ
jgi:hypothetical protein